MHAAAMAVAAFLAAPAGAAGWSDAGLPGGGTVSALDRIAAGSGGPEALIAGTERGTLYRSLDGGAHWDLVLSGAGEAIRSLLVDGDIVLAAAGTRVDIGLWDCWGPVSACPSPWAKGGLFRSADRGATWTRVDSLASGVMGLARANAAWYAAGASGLWSTSDKGASWKRAPADTGWTPYSAAMSAFVSDGTRLYALARGNLYAARPDAAAGAAWKAEAGMIQALAAGPGKVYVSARPNGNPAPSGMGQAGIFSLASGATIWQRLSPDTAMTLAVAGDTVLAASAASLSMSPVAGRAWTPFAAPLPFFGRSAALLAAGAYAFAGGDSLGVRKAAFASGGWSFANQGLRDYAAYARFAGGVLYSNDAYGDLLRRVDNGNWSLFPLGISAYAESYRTLHIGQAGTQVLAGTQSGLYTLGPSGRWGQFDAAPVDGIAAGGTWAAAFQETPWRLWRCSQDSALSCVQSPLEGFPPKGPPFGTTPQPHFRGMAARGDSLYIAIDSVLYRSGDKGDSWQAAGPVPAWVHGLGFAGDRLYGMLPPGGWPGQAKTIGAWDGAAREWRLLGFAGIPGVFRELAFRGQELYLATDVGVFALTAGSKAWVDLSDGLPSRDLRSVAVQGDTLAVGLMQGGLYARGLGPLTVAIPGKARAARPAAPMKAWMRAYRADGRIRLK